MSPLTAGGIPGPLVHSSLVRKRIEPGKQQQWHKKGRHAKCKSRIRRILKEKMGSQINARTVYWNYR
jgi:hypothetical protein